MPSPAFLFNTVWAAWALSWIVAAFWSAPVRRSTLSRPLAVTYALIVASVAAPVGWVAAGWPAGRWWSVDVFGTDALALATIPGFLFAWWARLHLGPLWSAAVVVKDRHRIVRSGPYAIVRHPIYTGILWAAVMTDVAGANAPSALSLACLIAGFWLKARIEEGFLSDVLDREAYAAYRQDVPMLVPIGWLRPTRDRQ